LRDPTGYGRIIRTDGRISSIVQDKHASPAQRGIQQVNTGILIAHSVHLRRWVGALNRNNAQGEYYLTDVVGLAVRDGASVTAVTADDEIEVLGINDRQQLALVERAWQLRSARDLLCRGVTLMDPNRFDLRGRLSVGEDIVIDVNVILEGDVSIGDRSHIGPNSFIRNARIGNDVVIRANCVVEDADIADGCEVGPFARLRPETRLGTGVHIGNFVEIKKSTVDAGSKINHLSYVGDTTIGREVNIGAGTITCNYDGAEKHRTVIGDRAFIGSDTQLVAPVEVGAGATIGAGSVITQDAPAEKLTLSRAPQKTIDGWRRPSKSAQDN